ncbi:MAG: hypothetical protein IJ448_06260 [Oscillospiraceae bacterium]|nr:hypothetical protein [Oscillospiraceae bacterium]
MSYHQDWLMRQIESITAMLRWLMAGEKTHLLTFVEEEDTNSGTNELYLQLQLLVRQGKICQAEDLLFEAMEEPNRQTYEAAVQFYEDLNDFSDSALQQANFSREEIYEGLQEVCRVFGLPYME